MPRRSTRSRSLANERHAGSTVPGAGRLRGRSAQDAPRDRDDGGGTAVPHVQTHRLVLEAAEFGHRALPADEGRRRIGLLIDVSRDHERPVGPDASPEQRELERRKLLRFVEDDGIVAGRRPGWPPAKVRSNPIELEEDRVVLDVDGAGVGGGRPFVEPAMVDGHQAVPVGDVGPLLLGLERELDARVIEDVLNHGRGDRGRCLRDLLEQDAIAEELLQVGAPHERAGSDPRRVDVVVDSRGFARGELGQPDAYGGVALEAGDERRRLLALVARDIPQRASRLRGGPPIERERFDVDPERPEQRLDQARKALGRNDHRDPRWSRARGRPPEMKQAVQRHGRLPVTCLTEHEQSAALRQGDSSILRGVELDVDERGGSNALRARTRPKKRQGSRHSGRMGSGGLGARIASSRGVASGCSLARHSRGRRLMNASNGLPIEPRAKGAGPGTAMTRNELRARRARRTEGRRPRECRREPVGRGQYLRLPERGPRARRGWGSARPARGTLARRLG